MRTLVIVYAALVLIAVGVGYACRHTNRYTHLCHRCVDAALVLVPVTAVLAVLDQPLAAYVTTAVTVCVEVAHWLRERPTPEQRPPVGR